MMLYDSVQVQLITSMIQRISMLSAMPCSSVLLPEPNTVQETSVDNLLFAYLKVSVMRAKPRNAGRLLKVMRYVEVGDGLLALIVLLLKLYFPEVNLSVALVVLLTMLAYYHVVYGLLQIRRGYREWDEEQGLVEVDKPGGIQERGEPQAFGTERKVLLDVAEIILSRVALATVVLGVLFRVMNWPMATTLLQAGLTGLGITLIVVLLRAGEGRRQYTRRMVIRVVIYGVVGLLVGYGGLSFG